MIEHVLDLERLATDPATPPEADAQRVDRQVNIYEAKSHFSRLVSDVEAGAEIVIARHGRPVARLVRFIDKAPIPRPERDRRTAWFEIAINASGEITATCGEVRLEGRVHSSSSLSSVPTTVT